MSVAPLGLLTAAFGLPLLLIHPHLTPLPLQLIASLLSLTIFATLLQLYAGLTRRIAVGPQSVGITTLATAYLGFRHFDKTQVRKLVVHRNRVHLLAPFGDSLISLPLSRWNRQQLQLLSAAVPCRSQGIWRSGDLS